MKLKPDRRWWAIATLALVPAGPLHAQDRPEHYVLGSSESGWWKATSHILVDWRQDRPAMSGLECAVIHNRYLHDGKPPIELSITHPVESAEYRYRFQFNLADGTAINRAVTTITVGGRPYQRRNIQSRIIPWFGVHSSEDTVLAYGIGREMFRPDETYPWMPLEFLIPQFFEVEGIKLGLSGQFEVEHGEYETRFEEVYIDMDGFREVLRWCFEQVNPPGRDVELPAELRRRIGK